MKGIVDASDIGIVLSAMCSQIVPVCKELNIRCGHDRTCTSPAQKSSSDCKNDGHKIACDIRIHLSIIIKRPRSRLMRA